MIIQKWMNAVRKEMVNTCYFEYVSGRTGPTKIEITHHGGFTGDVPNLVSWKIEYDKKAKAPALFVYGEANYLVCKCLLNNMGIWKGRDRESNGVCLFRPLPSFKNRWLVLCNQVKFAEEVEVDADYPEFRYLDFLPEEKDWGKYEWDLSTMVDKHRLKDSPYAICICGYDRPVYMQKFVQTLATNEESHNMPVFAFIDKADDDSFESQKAAIRDSLPHAVVVRRPVRFGCGRNLIDARRQVFDSLGYEKAFIFEDDMLVSEHYLRLCLKLFQWAESRYANVGAVQAWNWCSMPSDIKRQYVNRVQATLTNWWGYLISRKAWDRISHHMYKYEKLFLGGDYSKRPHRSIMAWFNARMKLGSVITGGHFPTHAKWEHEKNEFFKGCPTGQDGCTSVLFESQDLVRLCTVVNRGLYIGREGIHMNHRRWIQHGFNKITLDEFPSDKSLDEFASIQEKLRYTDEPCL